MGEGSPVGVRDATLPMGGERVAAQPGRIGPQHLHGLRPTDLFVAGQWFG